MPELSIEQAFAIALQHHQAGRLAEAEALYRIILAKRPDLADVQHLLGVAAAQKGQHAAAAEVISRAIAMNPSSGEYYGNLGGALFEMGKFDEAIAAHQRALELQPNSPSVLNNLAMALRSKGQIDAAIEVYRQAIRIKPDYADAYSSLANYYKEQGLLDLAVENYEKARVLDPTTTRFHDNFVYVLHFHPDYDAKRILAETRRWAARHADPLRGEIEPHENDRSPDRRLRIGYVSPDLRDHVVGRFMMPLLSHHDRRDFEVTCYDSAARPDAKTAQFRQHASHWVSVRDLSDAALAQRIRQDRIDILIDLTMHMKGNRLLAFARKPAPVQVTYLAYCSTTGLQTIDYRLTDPFLDPPGGDDKEFYSEESLRLPRTYWCYPRIGDVAAVGPLPALAAGHITFGCLNNFCKATPPAIATWCDILRGLPDSRLIVHGGEGSLRRLFLERIAGHGIDPGRVEFVGMVPIDKYFEQYSRLDIALDPFPYAGGTTTCDALFMGVPVVSLAGETAVSRGGLSILSNVGLPELACTSREQYVRTALQWAGDLPRLAALRQSLRSRMENSPLMDAPRFARDIEDAYRTIWKRWCQRDC